MSNQEPPKNPNLTIMGEPLWVDALKTFGVVCGMLVIVLIGGVLLALAIIAPWGRSSFDCSIWCVMERGLREMFSISAAPPEWLAGLLTDLLRLLG